MGKNIPKIESNFKWKYITKKRKTNNKDDR